MTLGCTSGGVMGCGSSGTPQPDPVDSELLGIYKIDTFQASPVDEVTGDPIPGTCDALVDQTLNLGDYLVLYSFVPNDNMDVALLAGGFCNDVEDCRGFAAAAPEPTIGYSFSQGSDQAGWLGFGNSRQGRSGDQCLLELQAHMLSSSGDMITISSDTVDIVFAPSFEGNDATCRVADGVAAYRPELPCETRILVEATREADL